jgi:hypothetical protein
MIWGLALATTAVMPPPQGVTPDVAAASPPPRAPLSTDGVTGHSWELQPTAADAVPPPVNEVLKPGGAALLSLGPEPTIGLELKLGWELVLGWDHTLGPELLGLALGWECTLGMYLAGAHLEAAESPCSSRSSKEPPSITAETT